VAVIRLFCLVFLSINFAVADSKNEFTQILSSMLQQDPQFKEIDFQTPYFETQYRRDFSRLILPTVALSFGQFEQHSPATQIFSQEKFQTGSLTAALDVFNFGRDWNLFRSSSIELKAQEFRVWSKLMEREIEIGNLLLTYMREANNLRILKSIVELKEKALKISVDRFKNGALSENDLNKVRLDVSNAKGEYLIVFQQINDLEARIKAFGIDSPPVTYPWEKGFTKEKIQKLLAHQTPAENLPQYQEVDLQYEALDHQKKSALGNMFGNVQLTFTRSYIEFDSRDQWEWRAGIVYTLPLFDQFRQATEYQSAKARLRASEVVKRFRKNLVQTSQIANKQNLQVAFENFRERKDALKVSGQLYSDSVRQFNRGQLSVNELLVDQDRLLRTEQIANQSLYQMHLAVISFCHAQGRPVIKSCF
jgi:outer membrane protein TolC